MHAQATPSSQHLATFSDYKYCESGDIDFRNCHVIKESPCHFRGWEPFAASHNPTKFDIDKHCVTGYIMGLVCHILQDHATKGLCDFMA